MSEAPLETQQKGNSMNANTITAYFAVGCGVLYLLALSASIFHLFHDRPDTAVLFFATATVFGVLAWMLSKEIR